MGLLDVLVVLFVVLKLCGLIGWSWWWVLSPLWAALVLVLVALVVGRTA